MKRGFVVFALMSLFVASPLFANEEIGYPVYVIAQEKMDTFNVGSFKGMKGTGASISAEDVLASFKVKNLFQFSRVSGSFKGDDNLGFPVTPPERAIASIPTKSQRPQGSFKGMTPQGTPVRESRPRTF